MSTELLEESVLCKDGLCSQCPSLHEISTQPLSPVGSGWGLCQPSNAVPGMCSSLVCVQPVEICFPSSCTWLWHISWTQSSKTLYLPSVGGISLLTSLSYPTQCNKYYCFPFFLTCSCPWTSTTLRMISTSSHWCWSQGTPNPYVIFYCILTYWLFCLQLIKFLNYS